MRTPKDIVDIANIRYREACALFDLGFYDGAYYLVGYAVELALKARICEVLNIENLFDEENRHPDLSKEDLKPFKTHNLKTLLVFSGKEKKLFEAMNDDDTKSLSKHWFLISNQWKEQSRYFCCGTKNKEDTLELINAIGNEKNGILTWILNK